MTGSLAAVVTLVTRQVAIVAVVGIAVAATLIARPRRRPTRFQSSEPEVRLMRCARCGTALATGAQFCHSCGTRAP